MTKESKIYDPAKKVEKSKIFVIGAVIAVLAVLNGLLYFEYINTKSNLNETEKIKTELKSEMENIKVQFNQYLIKSEGKIDELDYIIGLRNSEIKTRAREIEELINTGRVSKDDLIKAKFELELFKKEKDIYLIQVDSIFKNNEYLLAQNVLLQKDMSAQKEKTNKLLKENIELANKITKGSIFKLNNIIATGIRIKGSKEKEILKAKYIEKLRVCFTIQENIIVEKGTKVFFIRIIGPDGAILSHKGDANDTFNADGQESLFTIKGNIDYNNNIEQDVCMYWDKGSEYLKGNYITEVYESSFLIGKTGFILK